MFGQLAFLVINITKNPTFASWGWQIPKLSKFCLFLKIYCPPKKKRNLKVVIEVLLSKYDVCTFFIRRITEKLNSRHVHVMILINDYKSGDLKGITLNVWLILSVMQSKYVIVQHRWCNYCYQCSNEKTCINWNHLNSIFIIEISN